MADGFGATRVELLSISSFLMQPRGGLSPFLAMKRLQCEIHRAVRAAGSPNVVAFPIECTRLPGSRSYA